MSLSFEIIGKITNIYTIIITKISIFNYIIKSTKIFFKIYFWLHIFYMIQRFCNMFIFSFEINSDQKDQVSSIVPTSGTY